MTTIQYTYIPIPIYLPTTSSIDKNKLTSYSSSPNRLHTLLSTTIEKYATRLRDHGVLPVWVYEVYGMRLKGLEGEMGEMKNLGVLVGGGEKRSVR